MRVVLDTNVIISAFAARGLCTEVFEVCLEGHTIVTSEDILSETKEKLFEKIHLPKKTVLEIIDYLKGTAEVVEPENIKENVCRDKGDVMVIGTALSGKAQFIITGDEDLLILKKYKNIEIISPREFWNRLRA
jgi:putative PIN family toxin of toxin-antitoxin system